MIGPCRRAPRPIRWLDHNFVKGTGCFLCWLNISVQMRFGMPEGSRVGGFPVMEPAEQSMTGRPREWAGGLGQRRGMRKQGPGTGHQMKWRYREKYSCVELALDLINRPGLSYGSDISRRQTKLTQATESRVLRAPQVSPGLMCLIKPEQKQTRRGPHWPRFFHSDACVSFNQMLGHLGF